MEQDIRHIEDLAALQRKYELLSQRERNLRVVHDFAIALLHQHTLSDIVWSITKNAIAKLGFVDCVIYLTDEANPDTLIQVAAHGPKKNPQKFDIKNPITIPLGKGIVGTVALTREPEFIGDTSQDSRYIQDDDFRYSEIAVPIMDDEKVIGVIDSEHPEKHFFTEQHLELLRTIAAMAASKILQAQAQDQLRIYRQGLEHQVAEKTAALQKKVQQLRKSNSDLERFAYAASHDLAEPLRTISSFLQLILAREPNLSSESREYFNFVIDGAVRMRQLLDGLLSYTKAGFERSDFVEIDLNRLLRTVESNISKLIQEKNGIVKYECLYPIKGNEVGILQLFQNLVSNGIKFHHPSRIPIVEIIQIDQGEHFLFEVKDNGIGIEEAFFGKAFRLFGRLHTIEKYKGSGLGLSICKTIVENHDGDIWLESTLNKGTSVFFTIKK